MALQIVRMVFIPDDKAGNEDHVPAHIEKEKNSYNIK
jgi:hypothetical protein